MVENYQIFGIRAVMEAISSGKMIDKVFIQKGLRGRLIEELELLLKGSRIVKQYVPSEKLNRLTSGNHQGVVAQLSPVAYADFEEMVLSALEKEASPLFLILDHLSDVRNFGAIIRSAECAGVVGIVIPRKGSVSITSDAIKTSAGAAFRVPICRVENLKDVVLYLQGSGIRVIAATEKTSQLVYDIDMSVPIAIVMGAEDVGVHPSLLKMVDDRAKLPMQGTIGSLNVSVACALFLYEALRQRRIL